MRLLVTSVSLAVVVAACAPAAPVPSPTVRPAASPAASKPAEKLAPKTEAKPDWQVDWERTLAAARQEGKVSVFGPVGDNPRRVLVDVFQSAHGIAVDPFVGDRGAGIAPRVATERNAGQYLWDVYVGGSTTGLTALIPAEMLDPLEPMLILPDVKEPKNWREGALEFLDPERQLLAMTIRQRGVLFINTTQVNSDEFKSYRDLLDPKWKGKIALDDPRRGGPGQASFTFFYLHPGLGPDFIRALGRQEITLLSDFRQEADAVGRGHQPILIGGDEVTIEPLMQQGAPIAIVEPPKLREGSDTSTGVGALALLNRAPHPNAAKVFINWLLSREGQTEFARALGYISSRTDVPTDHTFAWRVPIPGAIKTYDMKSQEIKDELGALLQEVFGR